MGTCTTSQTNEQDAGHGRPTKSLRVVEYNSKVSWCCDMESWRRTQVFAHWMRYSDAWPNALSDIISRYVVGTDELSHNLEIGDISIQRTPSRRFCLQRMFLTDSLHSICWEIKLKRKRKGTRFHMGFIDGNHIDQCNEHKLVWNNNGFAVCVRDGRYPSFLESAFEEQMFHWDRKYCISAGDRFKLELNFESNECKAYYNDQLIGEFARYHTGFPSRLYLGVSFRSSKRATQTFETTLLSEKYRIAR